MAGAQTATIELSPDAGGSLQDACSPGFGDALDGLVLTTGTHGPIGPTRKRAPTDLRAYPTEQFVSLVGIIGAVAGFLDAGVASSIVVLSGGRATGPRPHDSTNAMVKVSLVRLVENLAIEEPSRRVNVVAPGFIASATRESRIAAEADASGKDPGA